MRLILSILVLLCLISVGLFLIYHPKTPLNAAWNPVQPLSIDHQVTPLTQWKLGRVLASDQSCLALLSQSVIKATVLEDFNASPLCHIKGRVTLAGVGDADLAPVETRCAIAVRMALWERHGLQPAAQEIFNERVSQINHFSSYNCRPMRTGRGLSLRMSTHATANAIDVSGFTLASGRVVDLLKDWDGDADEVRFLRAARDSSCDWFRLTLSPDYNDLHANHFHLQSVGSGGCR